MISRVSHPTLSHFKSSTRLSPRRCLTKDGIGKWLAELRLPAGIQFRNIEYSPLAASADGETWHSAARLKLPVGDVWVYTLHLNTPRWGLEGLAITRDGIAGIDGLRTNTKERGFESQTIRGWIPDSNLPTIVAGDFNMPVESWFYRRDWSHYQNAFSGAGCGLGHTKFTAPPRSADRPHPRKSTRERRELLRWRHDWWRPCASRC